MKLKLALLALALLTIPASAKTWSNAEDTLAITNEANGFRYWFSDQEPYSTFCTIKSVAGTIATLACDNGDTPKMDTISSDQMLLDGELFTIESDAQ